MSADPTRGTADQLAESAWLKLTSRAAVLLFSVLGSLAVPLVVSSWNTLSQDLRAVRDAVVQLKAEMGAGQAADDARLRSLERSLERVERRLDRMEIPGAPGPRP